MRLGGRERRRNEGDKGQRAEEDAAEMMGLHEFPLALKKLTGGDLRLLVKTAHMAGTDGSGRCG
jgi:hypothetical protein